MLNRALRHVVPTEGLLMSVVPIKRLDGAAIEANHRIANNLALIVGLVRFQAGKLPQESLLPAEEVRGLLQDLSLRIDAVGRLHWLPTRSNEYVTVDLLTHLREIADAAIYSLPAKEQTEIFVDLEPCPIAARQATAVSLIIGEALTNALKYSHPTGVPGKIGIASRRNAGGGLIIEVADDGVGLPEGFDPYNTKSTGMALMRDLAQQLSARLEFEQGPIGLCVRLELPPSPE
jgi:two-component sensor histidine kinase